MTYFYLQVTIFLGLSIIGILIGAIIERRGVPNKAIINFTTPDGRKAQASTDVTWSWTVYVFGIWALLFRGQFIEFMILWLTKIVLVLMVAGTIATNGAQLSGVATTANNWFLGAETISNVFGSLGTSEIVTWCAAMLLFSSMRIYYVAFANRNRLRGYHNKNLDLSQSPNLEALYKYVGIVPRRKPEEMQPTEKAGQTHDYVVPEAVVEQEKEDLNDYSNLTVTDLKLLLKSEGIPFDSRATKDQLLELIDEHVEKN